MDTDQLAAVLLGGTVTLAGTLIVQLFVVPSVLARTRRLERWENDVAELMALLEEQLKRAFDDYRLAAGQARWLKSMEGAEGYNQERLTEVLQSAETERREANKTLGDQMARLDVLMARIRRLNSTAPYWLRLAMLQLRLRIRAWEVDDVPQMGSDVTTDEDVSWNQAWTDLELAREEMRKLLIHIAEPMRPPKRAIARRAFDGTKKFLKKRPQGHDIAIASPQS